VLLRSTSGKAEFEIFRLTSNSAVNFLRAAADQALVADKCHTTIKVSYAAVGMLGGSSMQATRLGTASDLGWHLTVTAFHYAGNSLLLRA